MFRSHLHIIGGMAWMKDGLQDILAMVSLAVGSFFFYISSVELSSCNRKGHYRQLLRKKQKELKHES